MRKIRAYSLYARRQRRRIRTGRPLRQRIERLAFGCSAALFAVLLALLLLAGAGYALLTTDLPTVSQVSALFDHQTGLLLQPTRFYDRSGTQLLYTLETPGYPRKYVSLDPNQPEHFSPELVRVAVGLEDPDYWQNPGFHPLALLDDQPQTIAEQVALDLLLWQEPPGLRRSLRMRLLAAQLINTYGHVQVMEWYLNSLPMGHLAYGVDTGARMYLNRSSSSLTLADAALLLAVHRSPALNPLDALAAALQQRDLVLDQLRARGVLTADEVQRAKAAPLRWNENVPPSASPALAFVHQALSQVTARLGSPRLERGGLRVITTLDYPLQQQLNCLLRTQLLRVSGHASEVKLPDGGECQSAALLPTLPPGLPALPDTLTSSGVVIDPSTGQILALAGDMSLATDGEKLLSHAPGTLLAPFVAVSAFSRGFSPASLVWDIPPASEISSSPIHSYHGPVRLRMALVNDYLSAENQLVEQIGAQNIVQQAQILGLSALQPPANGNLLNEGSPITPLEAAQGYAIFASEGKRNGQTVSGADLQPAAVLYVEDARDGQPLWDARAPQQQTILSAPLTSLVHNVLSDFTAALPSLGHPNAFEIGRPVGVKLGMAQNNQSSWAAGYTRQRVAVFWIGTNADAPIDGRAPAGLWHALMQWMHRDLPATDWAEPAGITHLDVCDPSGQRPTPACPNVVSEVFLTGSEPSTTDSLYQTFQINRETGRLATIFTPPPLIDQKTFLVVPLQARTWAAAAGLPLPPNRYDAIQPPPPSADVRIEQPALYAYVHGRVTVTGTAAGSNLRFYQLQAGQGLNPTSWLQITEQTDQLAQNSVLGVWDTTGLDGLYALRLLVVRQDQTVETAVIQLTVDNTPPTVNLLSPQAGQMLPSGAPLLLQAEASDAVGVDHLTWWLDGALIGQNDQPPFVFSWRVPPGNHTLVVKGYDAAGNESISAPVQFVVK